MKVPTHDNRIVKLKDWDFTYDDYAMLLNIQQKHPNMLLEIDIPDASKKTFVPIHNLDLESFRTLGLYNA